MTSCERNHEGQGERMADTESISTENTGKPEKEARWYVAHTYSGYENKVKATLEKTIANMHLEDQILEVKVPVQEVVETIGSGEEDQNKVEYTEDGERKPQKKRKAPRQKVVQKKLVPGYVFVRMILNDDNWYIVRNTRGVTGFVGAESTEPIPLTEEEMESLGVSKAPQNLQVGDKVRVRSGVWVNVVGTIDSIDEKQQTVKISIPEFKNVTPVGMNITDITKYE